MPFKRLVHEVDEAFHSGAVHVRRHVHVPPVAATDHRLLHRSRHHRGAYPLGDFLVACGYPFGNGLGPGRVFQASTRGQVDALDDVIDGAHHGCARATAPQGGNFSTGGSFRRFESAASSLASAWGFAGVRSCGTDRPVPLGALPYRPWRATANGLVSAENCLHRFRKSLTGNRRKRGLDNEGDGSRSPFRPR